MRTSASVRERYAELSTEYVALKESADPLLQSLREVRWHYESRIKSLESYALKLETGRFAGGVIDDFFAATYVVENRAALRRAEDKLQRSGLVSVVERKPANDGITTRQSSDFAFDDLRLYLRIATDDACRSTGLESLIFELQIKTFLQHAWSIATHHLVYKGDDVDWTKERIAFQIKAMLEHAEITIEHAQHLAEAEGKRSNKGLAEQKKILEWLRTKWEQDLLPRDQTRLVRNLQQVLDATKVSLAELDPALDRETAAGRGAQLLSVSPYGAVLDVIGRNFGSKLAGLDKRTRIRLFVPEEQSELRGRIPSQFTQAIRNERANRD